MKNDKILLIHLNTATENNLRYNEIEKKGNICVISTGINSYSKHPAGTLKVSSTTSQRHH